MGRRSKDAPKLDDLLPVIVAEYELGMSLRDIAAPPERKISTATALEEIIAARPQTFWSPDPSITEDYA